MKMTGAEMVVRALEREGVDVVFGIPGGTVITLYDVLHDASFRHVLTRHEQAACHAADGYARVSGKVGVCIGTSGPGATNLLTGIANAYMDSVPLVVLTGQVRTTMIGTDAFQEADIYGATLPMVKHSFLVRDVEELPRALRGAFIIAASGRPGPVLVDLPVDVQQGLGDFVYPNEVCFPGYSPFWREDLTSFKAVEEAIFSSVRPVVVAGGGVRIARAADALREFAERHQLPVATSLMGKGCFPEGHALSLGMVGMHGTPQANLAVSGADLLIAVGTRFSDRSTGRRDGYAKNARIVHIDIDSAEFDKNIVSDLRLLGDAGRILTKLAESPPRRAVRRKWFAEIKGWRKAYPLDANTNAMGPKTLLDIVRRRAGDDVIVTTEVGQHQMWTALHWPVNQVGGFVTSGGLGTMGFGVPASVGAALAAPGKTIVCIAGDGSCLMNVQELDTISRLNLPIKIMVLNNQSLGMVRQWQELFFKERYSQTRVEPVCDYARLAEAFGIPGFAATNHAEAEKAVKNAFDKDGPALVEFRMSWEDLVLPMVPAGKALDEFVYAPAKEDDVEGQK